LNSTTSVSETLEENTIVKITENETTQERYICNNQELLIHTFENCVPAFQPWIWKHVINVRDIPSSIWGGKKEIQYSNKSKPGHIYSCLFQMEDHQLKLIFKIAANQFDYSKW